MELVECDFENEDVIENFLGDVGVVVCVIGVSEKEVLDVMGFYCIDYKVMENFVKVGK